MARVEYVEQTSLGRFTVIRDPLSLAEGWALLDQLRERPEEVVGAVLSEAGRVVAVFVPRPSPVTLWPRQLAG